MLYIGIDPSLTATGIVVLTEDQPGHNALLISPGKRRGTQRLDYLRRKTIAFLRSCRSGAGENCEPPVFLEGYSFGSRGQGAISLGEWGGVLRLTLRDLQFPFVDIAPAQVKKYVTGKGNSKKPEIAVAAYKKWGFEFSDDNLTDAAVLAKMCEDFSREHPEEMDDLAQYQRAILEKLQESVS